MSDTPNRAVLSDLSSGGDGMPDIARTPGHCTAHVAYEHDCPYCRDAELQVARWSDVSTDDALAATLRGAVDPDDPKVIETLARVIENRHGTLRGIGNTLREALAEIKRGQSEKPLASDEDLAP